MIFLLLIFLSCELFSKEIELNLGYRTTCFFKDNECQNSYLYLHPSYQYQKITHQKIIKHSIDFKVLDPISDNEETFIDPQDVSFEVSSNYDTFQIGFVRYRFSETFGIQLLDIANPRDYSEFIFNELSWSKRSVFGVNHTHQFEDTDFEIQSILTLWPNGDRFPTRHNLFNPLPQSVVSFQGGIINRPWFKDLEYGVRLKKLFSNGLDLSLIYFHHFPRPSSLQLFTKPEISNSIQTQFYNKQVSSLGSAGSYIINDWVLRGDFLLTFKEPVTSLDVSNQKQVTKNHSQVLIGIDRTDDNFLYGLQTQHDFLLHRNFGGWRVEMTKFEWWKPSLFCFGDYFEKQEWIQVKNQFIVNALKLNLSMDFFNSSQQGIFSPYKNLDRLLFDISYHY